MRVCSVGARCVLLLIDALTCGGHAVRWRQIKTDSTTTKVLNCNQEAKMIEHFSELALSHSPATSPREALNSFYPDVMLRTQLVIDACVVSAAAGGVRVPVAAL